jgi:hypothetical protein
MSSPAKLGRCDRTGLAGLPSFRETTVLRDLLPRPRASVRHPTRSNERQCANSTRSHPPGARKLPTLCHQNDAVVGVTSGSPSNQNDDTRKVWQVCQTWVRNGPVGNRLGAPPPFQCPAKTGRTCGADGTVARRLTAGLQISSTIMSCDRATDSAVGSAAVSKASAPTG